MSKPKKDKPLSIPPENPKLKLKGSSRSGINFDQKGQNIANQVNADAIGTVNYAPSQSEVQNKEELVMLLDAYLSSLKKATEADVVKDDIATEIEFHIKNAIREVEKSEPKRSFIMPQFEVAINLLHSATSATSLISELLQIAQLTRRFFQ